MNNDLINEQTVSIVVPIYNVEKYLRNCVDSLLKQSYNNIEIILVDDGSPDSCPNICDEYARKDDRVVVIHKQNAGVSAARNTGIKASCGKYICFVDSDDYVSEYYIEKLVASLENNFAECAICAIQKVDTEGQPIDSNEIPFKEECITSKEAIKKLFDLPATIEMSSSNKIFLADIVKENELYFNETMRYGEDLKFVLDYFEKIKNVSMYPESLLYIVNRNDSETHRFKTHKMFCEDTENVSICCEKARQVCPEGRKLYNTSLYVRALNRREDLNGKLNSDVSKEKRLLRKYFRYNLLKVLFHTNFSLSEKRVWILFSFGIR
ncbi:glycosyltransferase family 2 protein [[Ruminococcus] torques]|uniref:glycosyltransferase family 2 protein n=1 Tax=[Ruminococcus] torques TaxID=33039 RepID=UPI003AB455DD